MRSHLVLLIIALTSAACGGASTGPTPTPAPPMTPPAPTSITLSGHLLATNGGHPLPNVQADLSGQIATTDGAGAFTYQLRPGSALRLALTGSGIVPRTVTLAVGSSREVTVDAISTAGFDLNFYRQIVRNNFEGGMEPLRRWTKNPNVYLQTAMIDARSLDLVEQVVRDAVPRWTAGQLNVASVERGTGTREGQAGWLTVKWLADNNGHCGNANVGQEGGAIELHAATPGCSCNGWAMRPTTIRHEVGHAMGFWHTDNANDLMFASTGVCDKPIAARELAAAAVAYARPVGNLDPDQDPGSSVLALPVRVIY